MTKVVITNIQKKLKNPADAVYFIATFSLLEQLKEITSQYGIIKIGTHKN
jgi:hypothetical protein